MVKHSHWTTRAVPASKKTEVQPDPVVRAEQPQPVEEIKVETVEEVINDEVINKPPKKIKRVYFPQENKTIEM